MTITKKQLLDSISSLPDNSAICFVRNAPGRISITYNISEVKVQVLL